MTRALIVMPLGTVNGGSELMLQQFVEHRAEARLEPTIAFLEAGPLVAWCRDRGVRAVVVEAGRVRQLRRFGRTVRALRRLAREHGAEVVIGWMSKAQLYSGGAALGSRVPGVWIQQGVGSPPTLIDRVATALPARVVITNSRTTDARQRRLAARRATTVVYPAVDTARFDPARVGERLAVRRRLGLPEDVPIFGSVGRLDRWKGFQVLLDAVPRVVERHPDAHFVLVGGPHELDPGFADELRDRASRIGMNGQVRLVGRQPNPEEWMQAMDVFVHASQNEPFGMVVIEAMALGKPVVASAEGGPTEVITPGVDGLLAAYGDERAFADAISRFLGDGELCARVGGAAMRRAQHFNVQRFAREFGAAVATAVAER